MEKDGLVAFFRQLVPLSLEDEGRIRERFTGQVAPAKQYLVHAGEISQLVYFILEGCVRVAIQNPQGEDITCFFASEGQFVANYESFLTGKSSPYSLQCLEPCRLLAIDRKGLQELYEFNQFGERAGRLIAEHLFVDATDRLTSFYMDAPEQRYQKFLIKHPGLAQRIPQHYIAAYIGVRPQSLSRIKRRALSTVAR